MLVEDLINVTNVYTLVCFKKLGQKVGITDYVYKHNTKAKTDNKLSDIYKSRVLAMQCENECIVIIYI